MIENGIVEAVTHVKVAGFPILGNSLQLLLHADLYSNLNVTQFTLHSYLCEDLVNALLCIAHSSRVASQMS